MPSWLAIIVAIETAAFILVVGGCFLAGIYEGITKDECEDEHPLAKMNEFHYTYVDGVSAYWYAVPKDCRQSGPDSRVAEESENVGTAKPGPVHEAR